MSVGVSTVPWFLSALFGVLALWLGRHGLRALAAQSLADWGNPWLNRLAGLNRIVCRRFHRLEHAPLDLPATGGVLIVANHVSGLDPLLMIAASPRPLRFIIAREQYDRWFLRWLFDAVGCIPIGRKGGHRAALDAAQAALAAGEVVALFPQGGIQDDDRPVTLKPGVALMARATGVPVCALRIEGVAGRGRVLGALAMRSRARIHACAPVCFDPTDSDSFLAELAVVLTVSQNNPASAA